MFKLNYNIKNIIYKKSIYIVSTPIGNILDISIRALYILKNVDLIISEDTRITKKLLNYHSIKNYVVYFNEFNYKKILYFIDFIKKNKNVALVSDSGTPLVNDPGYLLINKAIENDILIFSIPGACSAISGLTISGLPLNKFCYEGFIPKKKNDKNKLFKSLINERRTLVFYESPIRLLDSLKEMKNVFGNYRNIAIAKEITKKWEKCIRNNLENIIDWLENNKNFIMGEITIILEGSKNNNNSNKKNKILNTIKILNLEFTKEKTIKLVSKIFNINKNFIYNLYLNKDK